MRIYTIILLSAFWAPTASLYADIPEGLELAHVATKASGEGKKRRWWPWDYNSVAHFISRKFIRPQFDIIKQQELPKVLTIVEEESKKRVPTLVDIGLQHLWNKTRPYAIGGAIAVGLGTGGLLLYRRWLHAGLPGLIRQFEQYDNAEPALRHRLDREIAVLKARYSSGVNGTLKFKDSTDRQNLERLKGLIEGYKNKLDRMLGSINSFLVMPSL